MSMSGASVVSSLTALMCWRVGRMARFFAAGAAQRLYAKGEQVRMVLIDPVCRQDFCCENRAALLRLLAEGQTPLALPEHFDQQTPDSQLADFISLAKTAGMVSQNLTLQAAETWLDNIAHLLRLLTEHTPGESVPVPCLMVYAAGDPRAGRQQKPSGRAG